MRGAHIVAVDEHRLPPMPAMVLREISTRFFPWHEIVEIYPADGSLAEGPA